MAGQYEDGDSVAMAQLSSARLLAALLKYGSKLEPSCLKWMASERLSSVMA
jgi:hypothetical protein